MEDDLNFFTNGRRPQFFYTWKMMSIFRKIEDNFNLEKMEDNLNIVGNGRRPQKISNGRQPRLFGKWKMTTIISDWKMTQLCWQIVNDLNIQANERQLA